MPVIQVRSDGDLTWLLVLRMKRSGLMQSRFNRAVDSTEFDVEDESHGSRITSVLLAGETGMKSTEELEQYLGMRCHTVDIMHIK